MHNTLRESLFITVAGILLGFGYTAVTGKGLFAEAPPPPDALVSNPPEYFGYEETWSAFQAGNGIILDSRSEFDYGLGHIRGSVNLPLKEFDARKGVFAAWPKDTLLITYCDGQECNSSMELATKLAEAGFTNVKFFFGGWTEWEQNQAPAEGEE